jgi:lysophospholipase L1-like esterase
MKTKTYIFILISMTMLLPNLNVKAQYVANEGAYDTTRIYKAMDKARNGGNVVIGVLGGSITAGTAASTESKRWANLMTAWWTTKFPTATITLVNAGIGGTGSDIGTFRVKEDLLSKKPDFVVVEFSVNDSEGEYAEKMMEGVIRQILTDTNQPGVMMLMLKQSNGTTAQVCHKLVGNHYKVPMISFADRIDSACTADGVILSTIYSDGLHPLDKGMAYIAGFIKDELEVIYSKLPTHDNLPVISTELPEPLITDVYASTYKYNYANIVPLKNTGWYIDDYMWKSETPGAELVFNLDGNAMAMQFMRHNWSNGGKVEVWVDNNTPTTIDAYWTQTWGPANCFQLINENLTDGNHELHIKIAETSSASGHYFSLKNVMKAGNIGSAAPIALIGKTSYKIKINQAVELDGTTSFDPDGTAIQSFLWNIESAPEGSLSAIINITQSVASFTPDLGGKYTLSLSVGDGVLTSVKAKATINAIANNSTPIANAGNDTTVRTKKYAGLNASASFDADDDALTYLWEIISKPEGSNASLYYETAVNASLKPDIDGEYKIKLTVNDSIDNSLPDTVKITAIANYSDIETQQVNLAQIVIYPNPSDKEIKIEFRSLESQMVNLDIYSLDGKLVYSDSIICIKNETNYFRILKGSQFPEGQYIVNIGTGQSVLSRKLIIN